MSPTRRNATPKAQSSKALSRQEALQLRVLEDTIGEHVKSLNKALGTLKKVGKTAAAVRRRHFGVRCPD